jgi:hypothetical protein
MTAAGSGSGRGRSLAFAWFGLLLGLGLASPARAEPLGISLGGPSVSLRFAHVASEARHETLGFVLVNIPLDRVAAPAKNALSAAKEAPRDDSDTDAEEGALDGGDPPADSASPSAATPPPPRIRLTPALIRGALSAALRAWGYGAAVERLASLSARAKSSALLPSLRLRGAHSIDETLRAASTTVDDTYRYTAAGGADLAFEAQATWNLGRLVFAVEELAVERLRGEVERGRQKLRDQVVERLFAWQRALLKAENEKLSADARAMQQLSALEAELELDALTGGWFSAELAKARGAE